MIKIVTRLAPSQAGGMSEAGMLTGGGGATVVAIGVPSAFVRTGPFTPPDTVPQLDGGMPGSEVIVQQVTIERMKTNPPTATRSTINPKMICTNERGPSF